MMPSSFARRTIGSCAPPKNGTTTSAPSATALKYASTAPAVLLKSNGKFPVGTYVAVYNGSTRERP